MNITDETKIDCLVKSEPVVFKIDIEEEINFIKEAAKKRHEHFKKSFYAAKQGRWKKALEKDIEALYRLGVEINTFNVPLHPPYNKYLTRLNLQELDLKDEMIYEILSDIFEEKITKMPRLQTIEQENDMKRIWSEQKKQIKNNRIKSAERIRNDNKASHYDAMQKYYFDREKQNETKHKNEIKALKFEIEKLQSELNYYKDKEELQKNS